MSRRATLTLGSRWVVIPTTTSVRTRSGWREANRSAVIAPIENPTRWNDVSPRPSTKASRSSTSQLVLEAVRGVPARPAVSARIGQVDEEGPREERDLRGEILATGGRGAVEQDDRRTGPDDVVADVEAVGPDGRHGSGLRLPLDGGVRRLRRSGGSGAGSRGAGPRAAAAAPPSSSASTRPMNRSWSPAEKVSTTVHSRVAIAPSRSGRPVAPGCQAAPQKSSRPGFTAAWAKQSESALLALAEDVDRVSAVVADHRRDEPAPIQRHHDERRLERDRREGVDRDPLRPALGEVVTTVTPVAKRPMTSRNVPLSRSIAGSLREAAG